MAFLNIKGLTKSFSGLVAVEDVNLHVDKGEIVALIGPNGAGKTTVFNLLTGVYEVSSGTIEFNGEMIQNKSVQHIVRAGIARTFQNIRLFKNMRTIENVLIGGHLKQRYSHLDQLLRTPCFRRQEKARAEEAIEILRSIGFEDEMLHAYAGNLPYGQQRKLEIARAMATGAQLLLLDEPAAGMNPQESLELMEFIRTLRDKGFTILLIEHDMSVVMNVSDRIYVLNHGKLIAEGLPDEIANNPAVIDAYLGSEDDDA